jgi:hypothetical protein
MLAAAAAAAAAAADDDGYNCHDVIVITELSARRCP